MHWTVVLGWLVIALAEPTNAFARQPSLSDMPTEDARALLAQISQARNLHGMAIIAYVLLVFAMFLAPIVGLIFHRTRRVSSD
ncbi:hypothetical protein GCM10007385_24320 [Tateyamaria omphalii]|nr:hypothetical protein GCM10007385_24320 [Tateyamaria omphalii]